MTGKGRQQMHMPEKGPKDLQNLKVPVFFTLILHHLEAQNECGDTECRTDMTGIETFKIGC